MKIYDIFSKYKEELLPLDRIAEIVTTSLEQGIKDTTYDVVLDEPVELGYNDRMCSEELLSEDKKVAYIMNGKELVAIVGYRND